MLLMHAACFGCILWYDDAVLGLVAAVGQPEPDVLVCSAPWKMCLDVDLLRMML